MRLDTALAQLPRVDFIKSDTDGHEPAVFEGSMKIIERDKPILLFEVAPYFYKHGELDRLFSNLIRLGYDFERLDGGKIDLASAMKSVKYPNALELVARYSARS